MSRLRSRKTKNNITDKNRLTIMRNIFLFIFMALIIRLFYIQVIKHDFYNFQVAKRRHITIPVNSGRGIIYDRNFIRLTDKREQKMAVIFPQYFHINKKNILFLQDITEKPYNELLNKIKNSKSALEFPLKKDVNWDDKDVTNIRGLFIVNKTLRYDESGLLSHVIGYVNQVDLKGMSGVERALDGSLAGNSIRSLIATLDGRRNFLPGEGYLATDSDKKNENLRLTVDYRIQKIIENIIDKENREGAIVVSDIETGEILAMVSRPNFNPNNISEHLNSKGDELYNKAIQMAFPPGSVFKIVVAAEALRQNPMYVNEIFYCKGYDELEGGLEIKCSSYENDGHGLINMGRAFAESCNSVFIQLAEKLGAQNIIDMAEKLGFNKVVGTGLIEERGNLPKGSDLFGQAFGNIAIGQGEILATPLQVNQLTQTIANDGLKKPLYIIKDTIDDNYMTLKTQKKQKEEQVLNPQIAKQIRLWMEKVMTEGTGRNAGKISNITAGKTGSAESSAKGMELVHAWFTGYYPASKPKYAITVFIQKGGSGSKVAVPIFASIVDEMAKKGFK